MAEAKTRPTKASVAAYLDAIEDETRRRDCRQLVTIMKGVTGCPPTMWGDAIVGFDTYRCRYANGSEADWPVAAFSPRKGDISVYLVAGFDRWTEPLAKLGRHKTSKVCLYIRRLADVDTAVLEQLVALSVTEVRRQHPAAVR